MATVQEQLSDELITQWITLQKALTASSKWSDETKSPEEIKAIEVIMETAKLEDDDQTLMDFLLDLFIKVGVEDEVSLDSEGMWLLYGALDEIRDK